MKVLLSIFFLSFLLSCQTRQESTSDTKGSLKSNYKPPNCNKFKPAPITDQWLQRTTEARVFPLLYNKESWEARWNLIRSAQKSVDIQYYILRKDPYAIGLLGLLRRKIIRDRIKVRIMVDTRGSGELTRIAFGKDYLQELASLGAEIKVFNPLFQSKGKVSYFWKNFTRSMNSSRLPDFQKKAVGTFITSLATANHDKMILVDDRYTLFGGRNISKKYFIDESNPEAVDDADILIDSVDAASRVRLAFLKEFNSSFNASIKRDFINFKSRGEELDQARKLIEDETRSRSIESFFKGHYQNPKTISILDNTSILSDLRCESVTYIARKPENIEITTSLHYLMANAEEEIWMMNQYFIPTPEFEQALDAAKKNGVRIHVITNSVVSDTVPVTQAMFQNEWQMYAKRYPNISFHVSTRAALMHSKIFVIDGKETLISSYNIDPVSQNINSEISSYVIDRNMAQDLISYMKNYRDTKTIEFKIENGRAYGMEQLFEKYPDSKKTLENYQYYYPQLKELRDRF